MKRALKLFGIAVAGLLLLAAGLVAFAALTSKKASDGLPPGTTELMDDIQRKVATDAIIQYEIAKQSGDSMAV